MSNLPYLKSCDRCQEQIKMQQINGKWAAYSSDGTSFHKCSKNGNEVKLKVEAAPPTISKEVLTLEQRVQRFERMINLLLTAGP
jgi:hypothetical protein